MFDEAMQIRDGDELYLVTVLLRNSSRLPLVFEWWMAELARDHLRLGVYFRAVAIMLQLPGAAGFERVDSEDDEIRRQVGGSDAEELLNVLAEALARLDVADVLRQVPGGTTLTPEPPGHAWKVLLEKWEGLENGLLNIIAACLDELIIKPGLVEIDEADELRWWQRWHVEV